MRIKVFLLLAIIYLSFIALGLPDALLGSAWNLVRLDLNVSLGTLGIMSFIIYVVSTLATLNAPRLLRVFETKVVVLIGISMIGVALVMISRVTHFYQMLFFAIPLGLGAGVIDVTLNHYLSSHYKASHMNFLHSFYGIGVTLGPTIMAYALRAHAWRQGYVIVGLMLFSIAILLLLSFPLWFKENTIDRNQLHAPLSLSDAFKIPGALKSVFIFLIYVHLETLGGIWIASYIFIQKGGSYASAALFTSIFYLSLTLGRLTSGVVSNFITPNRLIWIGEFGIVLAGVLFLLPFDSLWFVAIVVAVFGLGCAPIFPNMMYLNGQYFDKQKVSKVMSLQMALGYMGFGIFTPFAGYIFDRFSIGWYPIFIIINGIILIGLTRTFLKLKQRRT